MARKKASSNLSIPEAVKAEVETKAAALVEQVLKPKHVVPPRDNEQFNHIADIFTKWHGGSFYFCSTYACPGPIALSPSFEESFARLDYVGCKFNLSFKRHTGQWVRLYGEQTVDECITAVQDDAWFVP